MRGVRKRPDGINAPDNVRHMRHSNDFRVFIHHRDRLFRQNPSILLALDEPQLRARLTANHLPRQQIAVMRQNRHEHLIACMHVRQPVAVRDKIQRFSRVARKDDFLTACRMQEGAHGFSRAFNGLCCGYAQRIQPPQRIRVLLFVERSLRIEHAPRPLRRRCIVQIRDVLPLQQRKISPVIRHTLPSPHPVHSGLLFSPRPW